MPKLSVVLPSWGRYDLTLRMLNSISLQTFEDYELFFLGDACQIFEKIILSEDFKYFKKIFKNRIIVKNFLKHDGTSAQAINYAMKNCTGEYFLFLSNDDVIFPNHFENYYSSSKEFNCDISVFKTYVDYGNGTLITRIPELYPSKIGHSELCVKRSVIKALPEHSRAYGHDWEFISNALNNGFVPNFQNNIPTYIVNLDNQREHNWEAAGVV
jgi:glycosyltransferase involved in cell wall biosynthesis